MLPPPWNTGNLNSFYTKANIDEKHSFNIFFIKLLSRIKQINPKVCYLEMGRQNIDYASAELSKIFPYIQKWGITYYKKNPMYLLRGGYTHQLFNFNGFDYAHKNLIFIATTSIMKGLN
jgi:hypothetical protein